MFRSINLAWLALLSWFQGRTSSEGLEVSPFIGAVGLPVGEELK